ncbi:uncharacterized protein [Typha angustifolia]|uniref:uncharacterized protein n=1 Tax=Typha angustifolia TaxID=59011 RepID=UPI003C2E4071
MRSVDEKGCYNSNANSYNFEFQNGNAANKAAARQHQKMIGSRAKPMPSKWDDAQKWLVGLSGGGRDHTHAKTKPRNSNADDRRLLHSLSQRGRDSCSSADGALEYDLRLSIVNQDDGETKKIDCDQPYGRGSNPVEDATLAVRSVCLRDMGTEMTPIASKEPSRTGTPLRASTPVLRSPISSRSSTPGRCHQGAQQHESYQNGMRNMERNGEPPVAFGTPNRNGWPSNGRSEGEINGSKIAEYIGSEQIGGKPTSLESRAMAWDEAERAKYTARYKREEVKIQAWENHEKRKAEMEMRRLEVKAERMKSRAQEKLTNKLAATRRIAEEKRANAEAKLNDSAARTSEKADYIRRTGHFPSSFSFKLPSLCG